MTSEGEHAVSGAATPSTEEIRSELVGRFHAITVVWSVSGRTVGFVTGFDSGLEVGGFAVAVTPDGTRLLVQIHELRFSERDGMQVDLDTESLGVGEGAVRSAQVGLKIRYVSGAGQVLGELTPEGVTPTLPVGFTEGTLKAVPPGAVAQVVAQNLGRAVGLPIGSAGPDAALLKASGFSRHTFVVGQSGSGKTYALGVVLERLLVHTTLPMIVIDPNSDFVNLGTLMPRERIHARHAPPMDVQRYAVLSEAMAASGPVRVARAEGGDLPLRIHFSDLSLDEQAMTLGLDALADREEYSRFIDVVESLSPAGQYGVDSVIAELNVGSDEWSQRLLQRIRNRRLATWKIWATTDEPSLTAALGTQRAVVLDTGSLDEARERSTLALAVLGHLRRRAERSSVLLVIDEAHNLLSPDSVDPLQSAVTEYGVWIAGEGRKYGLHLLVSTQRPHKVHGNIVSQCDNLVLMHMNSASDIAELGTTFSHVPRPMIDEAQSFRQGEMLVAGPIAAPPLRVQTGERWCEEGGADLPTDWATVGAL